MQALGENMFETFLEDFTSVSGRFMANGIEIFVAESDSQEVVGVIRILPLDSMHVLDIRAFEVCSSRCYNHSMYLTKMCIPHCNKFYTLVHHVVSSIDMHVAEESSMRELLGRRGLVASDIRQRQCGASKSLTKSDD